ncbi:hypothetical protein AAFF_G00224340 [Aldrovandia affinis]|uniref:BHLH domain-containing protein n=1 Tax=Aldrovandia affinis TaxID=143900 RepID=A0AAD7TCE8_9TELE|nr:hypothetical protein AAFF_G00224340 [Aldrovandia affinis]
MESTLSQFLLQGPQLLGCEAVLEQACLGSDPGYYSASGSLSPASSIDSCCSSPPPGCWASRQDPSDRFLSSTAPAIPEKRPSTLAHGTKKSRSRYPGQKRQSASEREKLRMRDLTKALHHLRTYLPPSVAPAGQTLTKIDTLHLAIRYIAHLSAQLGPDEGSPSLGCPAELLPLSVDQDDGQLSLHESTGVVKMEQTEAFQQSFPPAMDQYPCPHQLSQNPWGDFTTHPLPEECYTLQQQLNLSGLCSL